MHAETKIDWTKGPLAPGTARVEFAQAREHSGEYHPALHPPSQSFQGCDGWIQFAPSEDAPLFPGKGDHLNPSIFASVLPMCRCVVTHIADGANGAVRIYFIKSN